VDVSPTTWTKQCRLYFDAQASIKAGLHMATNNKSLVITGVVLEYIAIELFVSSVKFFFHIPYLVVAQIAYK
jgi:hypothetical protein